MSNVTSLRLRNMPRYPARIAGTNGITVERENTDLVVQPDFGALPALVTIPDPDDTYLWAWRASIDEYSRISFQDLVDDVGSVVLGPTLAAIEATSPTTNQMLYFTGPDVAALTPLTAAGRALLDDADAAAQRDTLGLGSAALEDASDFATSAQGALADTSLQPSDIGTTAGTVAAGDDPRFRIPSVRKYGAVLDGVTDDSAAITAALAANGVAFIPWTATGFVAGNITLGTNQTIIADNKTVWTVPASASYGVRVTADSTGFYANLANFMFDLNLCPTSTTAIRLGTSTGIIHGFRGKNIDFRYCGEAIGDETHATNYVVDVQLEDCHCFLTRGRQVRIRRSRGFFKWRDFKIDHTFNTGAVTWNGAEFYDFIGIELEAFDVVGGGTDTAYQSGVTALHIEGVPGGGEATVYMDRVLIDNTRGKGLVILNCFNVLGLNTMAYQNLGAAIFVSNTKEGQLANTTIAGGRGVTGSPGGVAGLTLNVVEGFQLSNLQLKDCDGNGIVLVDAFDNVFTGVNVKGCAAYGYNELAASNRNRVIGARYVDNDGGDFSQTGSNSVHTEWVGAANTSTARTLGAHS